MSTLPLSFPKNTQMQQPIPFNRSEIRRPQPRRFCTGVPTAVPAARLPALGLAVIACGCSLLLGTPLSGQQPTSGNATQQSVAASEGAPADNAPAFDAAERETLVAQLGASSFARREAAATKIMAAGAPILPELQTAMETSRDAEVRMRASILHRRVAKRDFESRAERFLTSKSPEQLLPGWSAVAPLLGDHRAARELYVEISRAYPELAKAYEGTARDRALLADQTAEAVAEAAMREMPQPADAVALLLVAGDPAVPVSTTVERTVLLLVNKGSVRQIRNQAPLAGVYDELLSRWIRRSGSEYRQEVLWIAMQEELSAGRALALRTLHEIKKPDTLEMALQTVARFGKPEDTPLITHLLDDHRLAGDGVAFVAESGEQLETRISDVAMAAIATIHGKSLNELGFRHAHEHPKVAFQVESLGFPVNDEEARQEVRQRIKALIEPEAR